MVHKKIKLVVASVFALITPSLAGLVQFNDAARASAASDPNVSLGTSGSEYCAGPGVSVARERVVEAKPTTSMYDPNLAWLENEKSQRAVNDFWAEMSGYENSQVGGDVDFENRKLIVVFDETVDRRILNDAVTKLNEVVNTELIISCRTSEDLKSGLKKYLSQLKQDQIHLQYSASVDARLSAIKISTADGSKVDELTRASSTLDVPLEIVVKNQSMAATSRCGDWPAHYGGAVFNPGGYCVASCTAGFKVKRNSDGAVGMSTVGHCRFADSTWGGNLYSGAAYYDTYSDFQYGWGTYNDWGFLTGSSYSPTYYTDPCCPSTRTSAGAASASIGNVLCLSGSVTLARCSMAITDLNFINNNGDGHGDIKNVLGHRSDGTDACQAGDSGGPWFSSSTSKVYGVQSFGVLSGGADCSFNPVARMISAGYTVMTS